MQDPLTAVTLDGKYAIGRRLGEGGMGAVYQATHLGTTRTVAVKVIHPQFSMDPEFVERFRREAEASGRLRHPNIVDVTDFGFAKTSQGQVAYLVMEYLDGRTLEDVLQEEGRLSTTWVVDILEQVCSAVAAAHSLGIVHRDLKPANIWLEPNRRGGYTVKVLDFGLAKLHGPAAETRLGPGNPTSPESEGTPEESGPRGNPAPQRLTGSDDETLKIPIAASNSAPVRVPALDSGLDSGAGAGSAALTTAGSIMGTPLYMSPEQCKGLDLDPRSDIYSLAVIAYRMLCGETPFSGSPAELIEKHCDMAPPAIRGKLSSVPRRLEAVVMSALAKDPRDRPQLAIGFGSAARASVEGSGALLRHAVAFYSEHFSLFFKLSILASIPLIGCAVFIAWRDWRLLPGEASQLVDLAVMAGMIGSNLLAYVAVTAATAPLVLQLSQAPLSPPLVSTALAALGRRWWPFLATTAVVMAISFFGLLLLVIPGIAFAIWHGLYAPVVVIEQGGVASTLKRARRLTRRVWGTVIVIAALQFALPALVWKASFDSDLTLRFTDDWRLRQFGFEFETSGELVLYQLLNILVTPLAAIMTAELYLKARHAGGEVLEDSTDPLAGGRSTRS